MWETHITALMIPERPSDGQAHFESRLRAILDLQQVLTGEASESIRARVAEALEDPDSELRRHMRAAANVDAELWKDSIGKNAPPMNSSGR